jgi:hypothetical protein
MENDAQPPCVRKHRLPGLLTRIDTVAAVGNNVFVSNYLEFYRLIGYFRRYTKQMVGVVMGINNLLEIFNEVSRTGWGILESFDACSVICQALHLSNG